MQKIYLVFLLVLSFNVLKSQGENCSGAVLLTNGGCVSGNPGLTQNIVGCVGDADDDAWYKFVATATSHSITVTGSATYDAVLQFFSGTCSALISGGCVDNSLTGQSESLVASGLTVGATYYVRVYHYYAGSGGGSFTMCLNSAPPTPSNNNCANAANLSVNAGCVQSSGSTYGATNQPLYPTCAGTPNDDVWYTFTATNYTQTIQVAGSSGMDAVVELFSGNCSAFTSLSCTDNTFSGGTETVTAGGLTPGVQYFFRVYDYYSTAGSSFSVCVSGNSIVTGTQPNDEPCGAILLPPVTADCNYSTFSNIGATLSGTAPAPTACSGGTGGFIATSKDVWFAITVPASGNLCITPQPNLTGTVITDGVMALYSGSCNSLTQITCSDDADGTGGIYNYPGTGNDFLPYINATGLTPGNTVYLRYWGWGSTSGNFGLCVQAPTNDLCTNALYICDINGYSASTSPAYTPDRPGTGTGQMFGNNENAAGVDQPNGTNTGGIFGYYPFPGTTPGPFSSPVIDVNIENNSWIKFTAASPTIALRVSVYDCWVNAPGNQGVQMQIFSGTNCSSFTPVSSFKEGIGTYTVNATSLTVGNNYYLMVDGWGGNVCNYNIQAVEGVAFPAITSIPGTICAGQSSILTAPSGASGYTWAPTGETTQTISVAPGTQMTYTCYVGGVCGYKQTLTKTVFLHPTPNVSTTVSNAVLCNGGSTSLSGSGAASYTWTGGITNGTVFSPTTTTSYTVTGTSVNGCTNTAVTTVTVNSLPTVTATASSSVICNGNTVILSGSGTATTYTWTGGVTNGVAFSPTTTLTYTVTGKDANGCFAKAVSTISVNPTPIVSSTASNSVICNGVSVTLNGTGANTYTWSGGVTNGVAFTPTATATYTVIGTNSITGCTNSAVTTITVTNLPSVNSNATNSVICFGGSTILSGSGASTYTWSGGITNGVAFSPTTTTTYTLTGTLAGCTNTVVRTITVNTLPTVSSTTTGSVICNGAATTLNGTGANTYTWTGGVTNGVAFNPSNTTTYTVTGTDANGCVNTSVRTITVNSIPTSTATTSGIITCATNTVNLYSNLAAQSYTWTAPSGSSISSGTNSQNAVGQGSGTYTLHVMSAAGCSYSTTLATNINTTVPTASASNGTLTCSQTSTVLVGGPTSGVTYSWSGPGILGSTTSANITATVTGNYTLVTTSNLTGCSSTVTAVGSVTNNLTTPTVTAGSNQVITCAVPSVTLTGSATAGSNLSWSSGATTNTATVGGAGTYTLTATNPVTGCFSTSTVQVAPSAGTPNGVVSAASNSITCTNNSASISITSTLSPLTYSWTGPGTIASPTSSATSVSSGGTYTITITNTASCSQSYLVVVPTNTTPVNAIASIAASSSITCNTTSLTLSSTPTGVNYTYSWTGPNIISGANTANPVVGTGGNYSVTITNTINGCSGVTGTTQVAVPSNTTVPTLSLSANSATTTCSNPSTIISITSNSNPNTTYTWTAPSTGTISNTTISNPTVGGSGVFTVTIGNTINGCVSASATVSITADANIPTFSLSSNTAVITCAMPTPSVSLTSTVSNVSFSWTPAPSSGATTASPTFTAAGNYTCVITNTVNNCSTNLPQIAVSSNTNLPTAIATANSSITCYNTLVTITSISNPSSSTYTWSGSGIVGSVNNASVTVNTAGIYSVSVTNPVNGCVNNTITATVSTNTILPSISATASSSVITCLSNSTTLTAIPNNATWTIPAGGTSANPVIASSVGDYTATVTDAINGCSSQTVLTVVSNIISPDANAGAAAVMPCNLSVTTLLGSSNTTDAVSYNWSGPSVTSITAGGNTSSPTVTDTGVYTLTVTNLVTGCSQTATVNVSQASVTAAFNADPLTGEAPLTVNFTDESVGATTWTWQFGNGTTSTSQNPNTIFDNEGTYTVVLIASSSLCSDTTSHTIIVENGFTIEVPNVFTPNGDGANDIFKIKITSVKSAEGTIYNRWGQLLYSWDVLNASWDGKASNGENCPDATYFYIIKVIDKKDKEHLAPGYVLITR